jgi:hypothetical protein
MISRRKITQARDEPVECVSVFGEARPHDRKRSLVAPRDGSDQCAEPDVAHACIVGRHETKRKGQMDRIGSSHANGSDLHETLQASP